MTTSTPTRPTLVTVLVVLTVIGGVIAIITGLMAVIATGGLVAVGLIALVLGVVYLAVAKGLAGGNPMSRTIVAVVSVLQLVAAIITVVNSDNGATRSSAITAAVFTVVILAILYSPRANEFFGSR